MIELEDKDLAPPRRSRATATKLSTGEMMEWVRKCREAEIKPSEKIREWILAWRPTRKS
jgi:hypothetical protein